MGVQKRGLDPRKPERIREPRCFESCVDRERTNARIDVRVGCLRYRFEAARSVESAFGVRITRTPFGRRSLCLLAPPRQHRGQSGSKKSSVFLEFPAHAVSLDEHLEIVAFTGRAPSHRRNQVQSSFRCYHQ